MCLCYQDVGNPGSSNNNFYHDNFGLIPLKIVRLEQALEAREWFRAVLVERYGLKRRSACSRYYGHIPLGRERHVGPRHWRHVWVMRSSTLEGAGSARSAEAVETILAEVVEAVHD